MVSFAKILDHVLQCSGVQPKELVLMTVIGDNGSPVIRQIGMEAKGLPGRYYAIPPTSIVDPMKVNVKTQDPKTYVRDATHQLRRADFKEKHSLYEQSLITVGSLGMGSKVASSDKI